ncbi:hypothetical protein PTT_15414 [Pyrenophora teres f. teres 0-1]|uniref:Uncharacterized protein n=1 Tax=Pyrenophora teres f. teres (strain 0-1) TaxID=861557 RepID=E3S065_PYRTT|nr:hypothetical protein PTT_15414 [Pyrenophora teres f. teres 0-1]
MAPKDSTLCSAIKYTFAPADQDVLSALSVTEDIRDQTFYIEHFIGAIVDTNAIMAWLAEGLPLII